MENTENLPWYVQSTITSYEKLNFFLSSNLYPKHFLLTSLRLILVIGRISIELCKTEIKVISSAIVKKDYCKEQK